MLKNSIFLLDLLDGSLGLGPPVAEAQGLELGVCAALPDDVLVVDGGDSEIQREVLACPMHAGWHYEVGPAFPIGCGDDVARIERDIGREFSPVHPAGCFVDCVVSLGAEILHAPCDVVTP